MNIIKARNIRTRIRKRAKENFDDLIDLSVPYNSGVTRARLLDEGMVTYADGSPDFYLAKGTIEKYYNALPDDYIGSINLGHMSFANFPILLGEWSKKDLYLVDIGDGRKALDVDVKLDESLSIVQDLLNQPYSVGLSAEFSVKENTDMTHEVSEQLGMYVPVFDEIFIGDFAVVGECGNVNSSEQLNAEGGRLMFVEKLKNLIVEEETPVEEAVETLSIEEADVEEEVQTPEEEIELEVEVSHTDEVLETIKLLQEENRSLRETVEAMQRSLDSYEQNAKDFEEKFKALVVEKAPVEKSEPEVITPYRTDGIGEF